MTPSQRSNLQATAIQAAIDVGIYEIDESSWTLPQQQAYLIEFCALILQAPDQYAPESVAAAQVIAHKAQDYNWDYAATAEVNITNAIAGAVQNNAAAAGAQGVLDALKGIGKGLSNLGSILPLLIPLGIVLVIIFAAKSGAKKAESLVSF